VGLKPSLRRIRPITPRSRSRTCRQRRPHRRFSGWTDHQRRRRFQPRRQSDPGIPAIGTGANPTLNISFTIWAKLIRGETGAYEITTTGFDQLANFDHIGFATSWPRWRALAGFLGQFQQFGFLHEKIPLSTSASTT